MHWTIYLHRDGTDEKVPLARFQRPLEGATPADFGLSMSEARSLLSSLQHVVVHLINRRLTKRQQMRWSLKGAHYLLQTRVELLDGRLETCFTKRFPHFRSPEVARQ
jgi:hypothetical protein